MSGSTGIQYVFSGWTGDASGSGTTSSSLTMNAPETANATWTTQYQITFVVTPSDCASTTPTGSNYWADSGPLSISVSPSSGYTFSQWTANSGSITFDNSNAMSTTANVNGPGTITASLELTPSTTLSPTATPTIAPTQTPTQAPTQTPTQTPIQNSPTPTAPEFPSFIMVLAAFTLATVATTLYLRKNKWQPEHTK